MYTLHSRFCTFGTNLHAQLVLINKISASEISRKFVKIALLVGYPRFFTCYKVGGLSSYFLLSKDGRKPMKTDTLKALLPTDSEAPKLEDNKKKEGEGEGQGEEGGGKTESKAMNGALRNGNAEKEQE